MELKDSKTYRNLQSAFAQECVAGVKYFLFADRADDDGYEYLEKVFKSAMRNEGEHAEIFLEFLGEIGDTKQNLNSSIKTESLEAHVKYLDFAKIAKEEGFNEIAQKFEQIAQIEKMHKEKFEKVLDLIENDFFKRTTKQVWECMQCGHTLVSNEAPLECPVCGHEKEYFRIKCTTY